MIQGVFVQKENVMKTKFTALVIVFFPLTVQFQPDKDFSWIVLGERGS